MALCHITGVVYLPSGEVAAARQVVFRREVKNITAEYLGAVFPDDVSVFTNAQGEIDVRLLTGRYVAFANTAPRSYFGVVTVPASATANFADIIGAQEVPDTAPVWYEQALAARDEAVAAAESTDGLAEAAVEVFEARDQIVPLSAQVDADAQAVEAARAQVVPLAEQVSLDAADVSEARAIVVPASEAAVSSASSAELSAIEAESYRDESEIYAASSGTAARFYDTIALGRAAVADGVTFGVRAGASDGLARPTIYRRDSSTTQTLVISLLPGSDLDSRIRTTTQAEIGHASIAGTTVEYVAANLSPDGATYRVAGFQVRRTGSAVELSSYDGLPITIEGFSGGGGSTDLGPLTTRVTTVEQKVQTLEQSGGTVIPNDLAVQSVTLGTTRLQEAANTSFQMGMYTAAYFDTDGALVAKIRDPDGATGGGTDLAPLTARVTVVETDLDALEAQVAGLASGAGATTFSAAEIAAYDAYAAGWTYNFVNTPHMLQRIEPDAINHFIMAGESFAAAQNGSAASAYHTGVLHPNTYMMGLSEHSAIEEASTAAAIGSDTLTPLRGTSLTEAASGQPRAVMSDAEFYAAVGSSEFSPSNRGESSAVMAIYQMRLMAAAHYGAQQPGDMLLTNVGRSGATVEMWTKGAQQMSGTNGVNPTGTRIYSKFLDTVSRVKALADAATKPHRIAGVFWQIGRNNYVHGRDGQLSRTRLDGRSQNPFSVAEETDYLAALEKIKADFNADATPISGQARNPTWVTDQPDGPYTADNYKLGIGNATRKFARFDNGVILGSPTYHVPDKNHLDLNGYRWVGCQHGKALFRTLYLGERWKPLEPLRIVWRGSQILISFHVPVAPMLWREVLDSVGYFNRFYPTRGFRVTAGGVDYLTTTPTISPGGRCLILNLNSAPPVAPEVWYASVNGALGANFRGHGNLADSDATLSYASYVFDPNGMHAAANIPALIGNPYPQNNFCTAFHAVADRA